MKKLALVYACLSGMALVSFASAETLNIAGYSGVQHQANALCSEPNFPTGEMVITVYPHCILSYPLNLPEGKTIDSIKVAYVVENVNNLPPLSIVAYLAQNRINPKLGAIAIAGASATPNVAGQGFLDMPNLAIPVAAGSIYWVQIDDTIVQKVSSISVTYH